MFPFNSLQNISIGLTACAPSLFSNNGSPSDSFRYLLLISPPLLWTYSLSSKFLTFSHSTLALIKGFPCSNCRFCS